ncbi:MAG TPA: phosphodiester glycosidase family protein [Sphingomicrobium sp.]|nr:phosphodiester glycosidase family protein [Sphingomicrobium sp.]
MRKIDAGHVAFGMNAGMFGEDGRPIGLAVVNGKQVHKINLRDGGGNFHLQPNGVFLVSADGRPAIYASRELPKSVRHRLATQSGPMLVIHGKLHPKFDDDGSSRLIRNGVGVRHGKALFVISDGPVSFGKFARFFRDSLKTPDALFLDGSVSSLWDPANGRQDAHSDLGPIIIALKPGASAPGREGPAKP